jgi:hypothetical protein
MSLAAGNAENMGIDAVLAEIRRHAGSAKLQERDCNALAMSGVAMRWHGQPNMGIDTVLAEMRDAHVPGPDQGKIGAQGGIELVFEAMRGHAHTPKSKCRGVSTPVRSLSHWSGS